MALPTFTPGTQIRAQEMNDALATLFDMMYPVGSIYMSASLSTANAVNSVLPGTWQAWGSGRVPVGVDTTDTDFDTPEETGGRKWSGYCDNNWRMNYDSSATQNQVFINYSTKYTVVSGDQTNMPPYITCYMYKRIS